jgi:predicted metalloprotease with PDZ domain
MRRHTIIALLLWLAPGASAMASGAYLGAELGPVTPQVSAAISADFPGGAIVIATVPKSPAAAAGLKADDVVLAIDGKTINRPEELVAAIGAHSPGDRVRLSVVDIAHGYTNRTVSVRLVARPAQMAMAAPAALSSRSSRWRAGSAAPSRRTAGR